MIINAFESIKQIERVIIIPSDSEGIFRILTFTERWIRIYDISYDQTEYQLSLISYKLIYESLEFLDKIYDVIVPKDYLDEYYVGFAHNYVNRVIIQGKLYIQITYICLDQDNSDSSICHQIDSVIWIDECILFQLRFWPSELLNGKNLVAAATMFGSVCVWDYTINEPDQKVPVLYEFKGHQGVIYNLRWINHQSLWTTSGDRTIKIWSFDDQHNWR